MFLCNLKMKDFNISFIIKMSEMVVLFLFLTCISARRFQEEEFYPGNYFDDPQYQKIKVAIEKLESAPGPQWIPNWPDSSFKMGQVSGVALDNSGRIFVFHRGSNQWDINTFSNTNVYQHIGDPPIQQPTILVFNDTGELVDSWGQDMFYMPHGITVDKAGNVWVTDVACHQVYKFTSESRTKPALVLGEKFAPRDDDYHFCKPSAVAVLSSGDFFVADGYCNARIVKFAADGTKILQWGKRFGDTPFVFNVPHALALAEDRGELCVADRERGRVACFRTDSGAFTVAFRHWLMGTRIFSVAYAPLHGGRLYVVNGNSRGIPIRGYVIDYTTSRLIQTFAPTHGFQSPHDIAVSPDGSEVYVTELEPPKVYKFFDETVRNETRESLLNVTHAKPTATVEVSGTLRGTGQTEEGVVTSGVVGEGGESATWGLWGGAAGGALAAACAALLLALCRARNTGRKSVGRRRWEYGHSEFKLRRLLERRRFTRVHSDDSEDEPAPMLPPPTA